MRVRNGRRLPRECDSKKESCISVALRRLSRQDSKSLESIQHRYLINGKEQPNHKPNEHRINTKRHKGGRVATLDDILERLRRPAHHSTTACDSGVKQKFHWQKTVLSLPITKDASCWSQATVSVSAPSVATNKLDSLDGASSSERVRFSCNRQCKQPCQPYSSANTSLSHIQATPLHEWIKKEIKEECDDCTSGDILSPEGVRYNGVTLCVEKETYADVDQRNALSTSSQTEQPDNALNELPDGSVELESQNINAHERQSDVAATCFVQQSNNLTLSKLLDSILKRECDKYVEGDQPELTCIQPTFSANFFCEKLQLDCPHNERDYASDALNGKVESRNLHWNRAVLRIPIVASARSRSANGLTFDRNTCFKLAPGPLRALLFIPVHGASRAVVGSTSRLLMRQVGPTFCHIEEGST
ncbi:hypothetical protein Tcan_10762 [Toxocara canis]|uniref:Uncharacterized protein n=1 Tax=Toxocara canis TaxID=6265 RepID=A0A0B2V2R6_TOXCA|nr:hypothetical protein Tcan_10762 [Toxocara canis]